MVRYPTPANISTFSPLIFVSKAGGDADWSIENCHLIWRI